MLVQQQTGLVSPSSRRAWIEIAFDTLNKAMKEYVALLAEGVDRNALDETAVWPSMGRPPRGGRG